MRFAVLLTFAIACVALLLPGSLAARRLSVQHAGGTRETRVVAAFTQVLLTTNVKVVVRQGPQQVVVEGAPEDLARLVTSVEKDQLRIGTVFPRSLDWLNVRSWGDVTIYVTLPVVHSLVVESSGKVRVEGLTARQLRLAVSSSGQLQLGQVQALSVQASVSSSGHVTIQGLRADTLQANVGGSGNITAAGSCTYADLTLSSSGHININELAAETCQARLSGAGSCQVWVARALDAYLSSSGSLLVTGNPRISQHISGRGHVLRQQ